MHKERGSPAGGGNKKKKENRKRRKSNNGGALNRTKGREKEAKRRTS